MSPSDEAVQLAYQKACVDAYNAAVTGDPDMGQRYMAVAQALLVAYPTVVNDYRVKNGHEPL
jgi:hypothetical protein